MPATTSFSLVEFLVAMGKTNTHVPVHRGTRAALRHRDALLLVASGAAKLITLDWEGYGDEFIHYPSFLETALSGKSERMMVHIVNPTTAADLDGVV